MTLLYCVGRSGVTLLVCGWEWCDAISMWEEWSVMIPVCRWEGCDGTICPYTIHEKSWKNSIIKVAAPSYPPLDTLSEGAPELKRQRTSESPHPASSSLLSSFSSAQCAEYDAKYKDIESCFLGMFM